MMNPTQSLRPEDRLFIALDVNSLDDVKRIVETLGPRFRSYKIGMQLFWQEGPKVIHWLTEQGCRVFADLKFHDIPNTVSEAAAAMTRLGVYLFNVHVAGGSYMMQRTMETVQETIIKEGVHTPPIVLGMTHLTSTSQSTLVNEIGIHLPMEEAVLRYAKLAQQAGLGGVVASAQEAQMIRKECGDDFVILTPGIRPKGAAVGDQTRVTTPTEAMKLGSDLLVVGRPIVKSADMQLAAAEIANEISAVYSTL